MVARRTRGGGSASFQPQSLQSLAVRASLDLIESACKSPRNLFSSEGLRRECAACLPRALRQRLVEELLRSGRMYNTLQLYVFDVLLTEDIRRLAVRHVRRFYRGHFVDLLASGRARGLEVLLLEDMTWLTGDPRASRPLASALAALPNLGRVSLRFVCDDLILGALGASCPRLREVDASGALRVTDAGLQRLCLRSGKGGAWRRLLLLDCCLEVALDEAASIPVWWRSSVIRRAKRNPCCDSLLLVNLTATGVSTRGVGFLRASLPGATVLTKL